MEVKIKSSEGGLLFLDGCINVVLDDPIILLTLKDPPPPRDSLHKICLPNVTKTILTLHYKIYKVCKVTFRYLNVILRLHLALRNFFHLLWIRPPPSSL